MTTTPQLSLKEISDQYIRKNFELLDQYFREQNQLLNFKFFEVIFTAAETDRKIAHGLTYAPLDVITTRITGTGVVTFSHSKFDATYVVLSASGPCRIRFMVGATDKIVTTAQNGKSDTQVVSPLAVPTIPDRIPAGFLGHTYAATAPTGWLVRDGSLLSRASYPDLYAAIGTRFNTGGESDSQFRLPDDRGLAIIGSGKGTGLTDRVLGIKLGEEAHALSTPEIPAHQHFMYNTDQVGNTDVIPDPNTYAPWWVFNGGFNESYLARGTSTPSTLVMTSLVGGGGAHNNMQPSRAALPIIKT